MKITVCALTFKRPQGLQRLLDGLGALTFEAAPPEITILIVDNDPAGSARGQCEPRPPGYRWPICYVVESRRGIAYARNAALDNALPADWLCFIDDDEVPAQNWLDELIRVQAEHNADVVAGPVIPCFDEPVPQWMITGGFFQQRRHKTGTQIDYAYTNNVLFRARLLSELDIRFDHRWALMGCEDSHFFERIALTGKRIIWADDAPVTEWIPASRATTRWILQRAFRYGNSTTCVEADLHGGRHPKGHPAILGLKRIIVGLVATPISWLFGRHRFVWYLRHIWYGAGMIAAWSGWQYKEYRKTHGS